jgi:hypothetical protein
MQVPQEGQTDEIWHLKETIKDLTERVTRLQGELNRERLERDHWFECALDLRKILLEVSTRLS